MTTHEQVTVEYHQEKIEVDKGIAPLLLELWRLGIETICSCENTSGYMWVEFYTSFDVERFLNAALPDVGNRRDSMWARAQHGSTTRALPENSTHAWIIDPCIADMRGKGDRSDFWFTIFVRFPISDYPTILKNVMEYVE